MCTVEAHHKIAALAPDNNVQTTMELLRSNDTVEQYATAALFVAAMSEGYESNKAWEEPGYEPHPLTLEEINHLRRVDLDALFDEAWDVFLKDIGATVEAEAPKSAKKEEGGASG